MKSEINDKIIKYRIKHKDCKFCSYAKEYPITDCHYGRYECLLKRKTYNLDFSRLHGLFCKYYSI